LPPQETFERGVEGSRQTILNIAASGGSPTPPAQQPQADEGFIIWKLPICFWLDPILADPEKVSGTTFGKNSLKQHGRSQRVGISPLRAKDSVVNVGFDALRSR